MSNLLAGIGRGQLQVLDERVRRKREIFETYRRALGDLPGIDFMPEAPLGLCLPSGTAMPPGDQERVVRTLRSVR